MSETGSLSQGEFWQVIGQRAVAATIVTAAGADGPAGLLGLSATHVCADPPTMLVSVGTKTAALSTILAAGHFAINYLAAGDEDLVDRFSGKSDLKGAERFKDVPWSGLETGAPLLDGALAAIDCRLDEVITRHDTVIILGRVLARVIRDDRKPLVMFRGGYI